MARYDKVRFGKIRQDMTTKGKIRHDFARYDKIRFGKIWHDMKVRLSKIW